MDRPEGRLDDGCGSHAHRRHGAVTVKALVDDSTAFADARGGNGPVLIAVTLLAPSAKITGSVRAYIGHLGDASVTNGALFKAGSLDIEAEAKRVLATATLLTVSIGLIGAGNGPSPGQPLAAQSEVSGSVNAWVAPNDTTAVAATRAPITVTGSATISSTTDAISRTDSTGCAKTAAVCSTINGGAGSFGIAAFVLKADATMSRSVKAWVGDGVTLTAADLLVSADTESGEAFTALVTGAGGLIGSGGHAEGTVTASGSTEASLGVGAQVTVTGGAVAVKASSTT